MAASITEMYRTNLGMVKGSDVPELKGIKNS
jgi:hypothetical protein